MRIAAALVIVLLLASCGAKKSEKQVANDALNRGLTAEVAKRYDEAEKDFREVLVHDPNNKYAYYNLGLIAQLAGRTADAERDYRTVLHLDPKYEPALFNLAIVLTKSAPQEALSLYRQAIAAKPSDAGAHLNLGFLLKALGKKDEAQKEIEKAIKLDPSLGRNGAAQPTASPKR
jgi:tetratricopeptide (TPR) repeat protein